LRGGYWLGIREQRYRSRSASSPTAKPPARLPTSTTSSCRTTGVQHAQRHPLRVPEGRHLRAGLVRPLRDGEVHARVPTGPDGGPAVPWRPGARSRLSGSAARAKPRLRPRPARRTLRVGAPDRAPGAAKPPDVIRSHRSSRASGSCHRHPGAGRGARGRAASRRAAHSQGWGLEVAPPSGRTRIDLRADLRPPSRCWCGLPPTSEPDSSWGP
jgi:hypothetical protein